MNEERPTGFYPYRSGYEIESMNYITGQLNSGNFKGVISTSALEIGIDIEGLNLVVIADMPHDKNSYQQRIGRVGRTNSGNKSYVLVVRTSSFSSDLLFDSFNYDIDKVLPTYEPALYLTDDKVLNIHAHCHVGDIDDCEYKLWKPANGKYADFKNEDCFPPEFAKRCQEVLDGNYPQSYSNEVAMCYNPHFSRPLRYFGDQFTIQRPVGSTAYIPKEMITRSQVATEGYPGAVRNTMRGKERFREQIKGFDKEGCIIYAEECTDKQLTTKGSVR